MSSFSPSPTELNLANQILAKGDPGKLGIITGENAVKIFGGAKLPAPVLGEIWSIADDENNGWLSRKGLAVALRLIGWAQSGEKVTAALVNKPGPIPSIEGLSSVASHSTGMSIPKSPPPSLSLPPLSAQDKAKFQRIFQSSNPQNGLLSGELARDIFVKSKLPVDKLSQIWGLADTKDRGSLDSTDFIIGMYFIQGCMSGSITFIPTSLPPGFYEQAAGIPVQMTGVTSHSTGTFNTSGTTSSLRPQYTGASNVAPVPPRIPSMPTPSVVGASAFGTAPNPTASAPAVQWDVTPAEKTNSDRLFDGLDTQKQGYIEGDVAVPFMLESKLSGDDLAQIWDLADIQGDGRLTRDGFAVAMHLIKGRMAGRPIPSVLPATLVPPSLRSAPPSFPPSSPFAAPKQPEIPRDLLWGDDEPSVPTPQPQAAIPRLQPTATGTLSSPPTKPTPSADPFGTSFSTQDLLGDDNDVDTQPLHDKSAEIGNVQNQLNSTNRSLETTKTERADIEARLADQAAQLSQLQTQLSSAKASYETETKLLGTLHERYSTQTSEIQQSREKLIRAESELSAIKVEKSEIEGSFLRDKEEARELHRKMVETGQQVEIMKAEIEKLKKEAKQQKGLLAIAKKQLSTKENEKAKVEKEIEELQTEVRDVTQEKDKAEAKVAMLSNVDRAASSDTLVTAAAQPLPLSPDVTGATSPGTKSKNPFDKMHLSSTPSTPRSQPSTFLPFADASVPTPTALPASSNTQPTAEALSEDFFSSVPTAPANTTQGEDPFGFNDAFGPDMSQQPAAVPDQPKSPTVSSETDQFATPPSTAKDPVELSLASPVSPSPVFEELSGCAPEISKPSEIHNRASTTEDTDLNSQLKELDVDDSDSSDDEDEVPLATLASRASVEAQSVKSPQTNGTLEAPEVTSSATTPSSAAFNSTTPNASSTTPAPSASIAGATAFDETMSKLSGGPAAQVSAPTDLTFDSFDDNFDFGSVAPTAGDAPPFAPAPAVNGTSHSNATPVNGTTASQPATGTALGFDDIFSSDQTQAKSQPTEKPTETSSPTTFDDIFSGLSTSPNAEITAVTPSAAGASATEAPRTTFPPVSSPKGSMSSNRAASPPPQSRSPPPQIVAPARPRASTSSSKDDKEKQAAPRHSKISIRLPFGKKKKSEAPPPPSRSKLLTPPDEEVSRITTPAVDDDVDAVKQLCGMGFSRSQAVEALEKHGYDVPKALNSLLGQ